MISQKTKKAIARELLILIGLLILTSLAWSFLIIRNQFIKSSITRVETELLIKSKKLDSLQSITERITFIDLIQRANVQRVNGATDDGLPIYEIFDLKKSVSKDFYEIIALDSVIEDPDPNPILQSLNDPMGNRIRPQIVALYRLLSFLKFKFTLPPTAPSGVIPTYSSFEAAIIKELDYDSNDTKELREIYEYLLNSKVLNIEFEEFTYSMGGGSLIIDKVQKLVLETNELESVLNKPVQALSSRDEIIEKLFLILIISFTLSYPFRFLIMAIIWAIKTLKEG